MAVEKENDEAARRRSGVANELKEKAEAKAREAAAAQELEALKQDLLKIADIEVRENIDKETENNSCVVCLDAPKTMVLMPCKHLVLCDSCGNDNNMISCPMCRVAITSRFHVFS
jgi:hypothetical protein